MARRARWTRVLGSACQEAAASDWARALCAACEAGAWCTGLTARTRYFDTFLSQFCAALSALVLPPYDASPKKARCFGLHDPSRVR